jgi:hypothetical protein
LGIIDHCRAKLELDTMLTFEPARKAGHDLSRIDAGLGCAPETAFETIQPHGPGSFTNALRVKELDLDTSAASLLNKLAENSGLVIVIGEVERPGALVPEPCRDEDLMPDCQTPQRQVVEIAERLADRPEHAEVADRSTRGASAPFEDNDATTAPRELVCMRQPEDARADDRVVEANHPLPSPFGSKARVRSSR